MSTLRQDLESDLLAPLRARLGGRLVAVVGFGSATDFLDVPEDERPLLGGADVLVVVDALDLGLTDDLRKVLSSRALEFLEVTVVAAGELPRLAELFPLESADLLERRVLLDGPDPLEGVEVPERNLLHQVGAELVSKRQALIGLLLAYGPTHPRVGEQVLGMGRAFGPLARGLLRLRGHAPAPGALEEVLEAAVEVLGVPRDGAEAVRELQASREERRRPARTEKRDILEAFLGAWEALVTVAAGGQAPPPPQGRLPFSE